MYLKLLEKNLHVKLLVTGIKRLAPLQLMKTLFMMMVLKKIEFGN